MWLQGAWAHWHQEHFHKSRSHSRWPQTAFSKVTGQSKRVVTNLGVASASEKKEPCRCLQDQFSRNTSLRRRGRSSFISEGNATRRTSREGDNLPMSSSNLSSPLRQTWRSPIPVRGRPQWKVKVTTACHQLPLGQPPKAAPQGSHVNHRVLHQLAQHPDDTGKGTIGRRWGGTSPRSHSLQGKVQG